MIGSCLLATKIYTTYGSIGLGIFVHIVHGNCTRTDLLIGCHGYKLTVLHPANK